MAEWSNLANTDTLDADFLSVRSLFLSGSVTTMYKLVKQSPTKIAKLLGLNYSSYHSKLVDPEKFTVFHINLLAYALKIDPSIIHNVIQKEIQDKVKSRFGEIEKKL